MGATNQQAIQDAQRDFQRGDYSAVLDSLAGLTTPDALHLRGLAARRLGDVQTAFDDLLRAHNARRKDPAIARNFGLAARAVGRHDLAAAAFEQAVTAAPRFVAGWQSLGRTRLDLEQLSAAEDAFDRALALDPKHVSSRFGLASVYLESGRLRQAQALFEALRREGVTDATLSFMLGRCALHAGNMDAALGNLLDAYRRQPSPQNLKTLANTLWMTGSGESFRSLLEQAAQLPELTLTAAELARQAEDFDLAVRLLDQANDQTAGCHTVRAYVLIDRGDGAGALQAAARALALAPESDAAAAAQLSALLMQGRADEALALVAPIRARDPHNQHWLAYEATGLRLTDPAAYQALMGEGNLIRAFELPVPAGFSSLEAFLEALIADIDTHRPYQHRPLDQSLRGGTQTQIDLLHMDSPVVQAYLSALEAPVAGYLNAIELPAGHPLQARHLGGFEVAECWSVDLAPGGFHVNHVHPRGWLSSASYLAVPPATREQAAAREGWIKFGEPPFPTEPALAPDQWIEPQPGHVVLFPSFVWHGTVPFTANARRITAPFDVVPAQPAA